MANKEGLIHLDYTAFNLVSQLRAQIHTIIGYMQQVIPYGEEYITAYKQLNTLLEEEKVLEKLLLACFKLPRKEKRG